MPRKNPQSECDNWNARHAVGVVVDYSEVVGVTEPTRYTTATEAQVLSGHSAVVWLEGKSGCVQLSHCKPC